MLHRCDNPPCVNPGHLFLGTSLDNMRDMIAKGRDDKVKGERHPAATITDEDVRRIRQAYRDSGGRRGVKSALAREYRLSLSHICGILMGVYWKHIL